MWSCCSFVFHSPPIGIPWQIAPQLPSLGCICPYCQNILKLNKITATENLEILDPSLRFVLLNCCWGIQLLDNFWVSVNAFICCCWRYSKFIWADSFLNCWGKKPNNSVSSWTVAWPLEWMSWHWLFIFNTSCGEDRHIFKEFIVIPRNSISWTGFKMSFSRLKQNLNVAGGRLQCLWTWGFHPSFDPL